MRQMFSSISISSSAMAILCKFLLVVLTVVSLERAAADVPTYRLGFLAPSPGAAIPEKLAIEWKTAFQVALEVLNGETQEFKFEAVYVDSACDYQTTSLASWNISKQSDVIGVVGPACSGAAISAASALKQNGFIPLVSFSATAEALSSRDMFPNFFRTVYSDSYQASAVAASILKFNMSKATLLYTKDYYSLNLAERILHLSGSAIAKAELLEPGANSSVDLKKLEGVLNQIDPNNFVLLVVQPAVAEDIWTTASNMRMTTYPWWYFGTDGTTAFDPSNVEGKITESSFATLQGEIGLAPFEGDYSATSFCSRFYKYWQSQGYPGLPATDPNKSRTYVPYLIDTVALYFQVANMLTHSGTEVNTSTVFAILNGSGPGLLQFKGCTGVVQLDPTTGSRLVSADQPALYDLVSLTQDSWELKGRITDGTFTALQPLMRPGTYPALNQDYIAPNPNTPHKKRNGALIAGITILVATVLVVASALFYFHEKCQKSPTSFFRMQNA